MPAIVNKYFNKSSSLEQTLLNKLKTESIQVMGREYFYIPRHVLNIDPIFGEDVLSRFPLAIPVEMYMENVMGFQGENEIFSKFGMEINSSYNLIMSVDRWAAEVGSQFDNDDDNGEANFRVLVNSRPQEGDLVYDPLTKFLMEIKFVDHDSEFYQVGKNYLYKLSCEAYQYNSEDIETGIADIDSIDSLNSLNVLDFQLLLESGDLMLQENSSSLIQENGTKDVAEFTPGRIEYDRTDDFINMNLNTNWKSTNPFASL